MYCLSCGQPIPENCTDAERTSQWHQHCAVRFFGPKGMPELDISDDRLEQIIDDNLKNGYTIPGIQKKMSLHLFSQDNDNRLTLVDYPSGYILKPQTPEFKYLPEYEYLAMSLARKIGIQVAPFALIKNGDNLAYITRRIDRTFKTEEKLAMEDFCQLAEKLTEDKYMGSYESCAKIIKRYSSWYMLDISELFTQVVFAFIVGNSDLHLKNFSLIELAPGSREFKLSQAYDILPVKVILPDDQEQLALSLNGKKNKIELEDFLAFADAIELGQPTAQRIINKVISDIPALKQICQHSFLPTTDADQVSSYMDTAQMSLTNSHKGELDS